MNMAREMSETEDETIKVSINDERVNLEKDLTIEQLLHSRNIAVNSVAVVCNARVITKSEWSKRLCIQGDEFEIFAVVAGG
ncbi:sulfur carrier protein ThiS [uncultured Shewanella sp.]|uniref:sulfur carrier protein ThiS n=1 Tax=Shewanella atlantica TaxID=271099 RepID=UPI002604563F|nr:sulfur carrier protein ThiS [uncultured Shewanella sp.]